MNPPEPKLFGAAADLFGGEAAHLLDVGADEGRHALAVGSPRHVGDVSEQRAVLLLAAPARLLGAQALGHVRDEREPGGHAVEGQLVRLDLDVDVRAVLLTVPEGVRRLADGLPRLEYD